MKLLSFLLLLGSAAIAHCYTVNGTTFTTDGSVGDANNAELAAADGDTIVLPPGTFTWGTNNIGLGVYRCVNVFGSGTGQTTILIDPNCTLNSIFPIMTSGTVGNFTIVGHASGITAPFSTSGSTNGWRVTNVNYNAVTNNSGAYFCFIAGNYGLIDNCTISLGSTESELIFGRGPANSWQTPNSMGTQNAVVIESSTFNGTGYVTDANSNARFVVRFCTITGEMWIDGHGLASNSPARGVRQMEIYGNTWTSNADNWQCMDLRGGTGMVFNNTVPNANPAWIKMNEYGALSNTWPNFGSTYMTPTDYPVQDQIGEGMDQSVAGSPGGPFTPAGYVKAPGGAEPYYLWNNTLMGANFTISPSSIPAAAIAQYQSEVGGTTATFTMIGPPSPDIIEEGRDFFEQGGLSGAAPFTGADGIGVGTTAQMNAITPSKVGVGFWVTDQGNWNTLSTQQNTSGLLYVWKPDPVTGVLEWQNTYTPLQYPDPQTNGIVVATGTGSTGTGSTGTGSTGTGSTGTGTTGTTGTGSGYSGGWTSTNGVWTFSPYAPSAPATVPPPPTSLRVSGS